MAPCREPEGIYRTETFELKAAMLGIIRTLTIQWCPQLERRIGHYLGLRVQRQQQPFRSCRLVLIDPCSRSPNHPKRRGGDLRSFKERCPLGHVKGRKI